MEHCVQIRDRIFEIIYLLVEKGRLEETSVLVKISSVSSAIPQIGGEMGKIEEER